ncbi:MAG: nitrile hydratase accessory protein [Mycobacterium sp.]
MSLTDDVTFEEPWQARAFAIRMALQEAGMFTAAEWSSALGSEVERAQLAGDPDDGSTHYRHWLAALERLATANGAITPELLESRRAAWDRAAKATPHGRPITLENDPIS